MAKRRKTKTVRRRRRVGAAKLNANNPIIKFGSIAAGYFLADKINAPIDKLVGSKLDGKIVAGAEVAGGYLLAFKGRKSLVKQILGGALIGAGAKKAMASFGIGGIGPYGRVPVVGSAVGPYGRVPVIGAKRIGQYSPNASLNGYTPNGSLGTRQKIVGSVSNASGSGLTHTAGSDYMN